MDQSPNTSQGGLPDQRPKCSGNTRGDSDTTSQATIAHPVGTATEASEPGTELVEKTNKLSSTRCLPSEISTSLMSCGNLQSKTQGDLRGSIVSAGTPDRCRLHAERELTDPAAAYSDFDEDEALRIALEQSLYDTHGPWVSSSVQDHEHHKACRNVRQRYSEKSDENGQHKCSAHQNGSRINTGRVTEVSTERNVNATSNSQEQFHLFGSEHFNQLPRNNIKGDVSDHVLVSKRYKETDSQLKSGKEKKMVHELKENKSDVDAVFCYKQPDRVKDICSLEDAEIAIDEEFVASDSAFNGSRRKQTLKKLLIFPDQTNIEKSNEEFEEKVKVKRRKERFLDWTFHASKDFIEVNSVTNETRQKALKRNWRNPKSLLGKVICEQTSTDANKRVRKRNYEKDLVETESECENSSLHRESFSEPGHTEQTEQSLGGLVYNSDEDLFDHSETYTEKSRPYTALGNRFNRRKGSVLDEEMDDNDCAKMLSSNKDDMLALDKKDNVMDSLKDTYDSDNSLDLEFDYLTHFRGKCVNRSQNQLDLVAHTKKRINCKATELDTLSRKHSQDCDTGQNIKRRKTDSGYDSDTLSQVDNVYPERNRGTTTCSEGRKTCSNEFSTCSLATAMEENGDMRTWHDMTNQGCDKHREEVAKVLTVLPHETVDRVVACLQQCMYSVEQCISQLLDTQE